LYPLSPAHSAESSRRSARRPSNGVGFASRYITMQYKERHLYGTSTNDAIASGACHQIRAVSQKAKTQEIGSGTRGFGTISRHPAGSAPHRAGTRSSRQCCQRPARLGPPPPPVLDPPVAPWPLSSCWIQEPLWRPWTETRSCTITASPSWKNGPVLSSRRKRY